MQKSMQKLFFRCKNSRAHYIKKIGKKKKITKENDANWVLFSSEYGKRLKELQSHVVNLT